MILNIVKLLYFYYLYYKIKYPVFHLLVNTAKMVLFITITIKRILLFSILPWYVTYICYNIKNSQFIEINFIFCFKIHVISFILLCYFLYIFIIMLSLNITSYKTKSSNVFLQLLANIFYIFLFSKIVYSFIYAPYASLFLKNGFLMLV